ncbi:hypothetical protein [Nocardioides litoris]|uniref:hypothetical protein n=1 Tax=Nocardioides litoris TaxID=1926648 RepID=UPI001476DAD3|nr:hypothetical protein [Nocardioides litoris]
MSTRPSARPTAPATAVTVATVVLALALAGCGGDPEPRSDASPSAAGGTASAAPSAPAGETPTVPADLPRVTADLAATLQGVLDRRGAAVLDRDRPGFLATLADDPDLRTAEGGYFDNLVQLPLSQADYRLEPASLVRTGRAYWGVVAVTTRLTPYDATPVRTLDRYRFVPAAGGTFRVASTTDTRWEVEHPQLRQPWDTEPVTVVEGAGVLGVFDTADQRQRAGIVRSVERGIVDVAARVPFTEWGSQAVVYALADPRFLDSFEDVPGGDPEALDGVAFTVPSGTDETSVAGTRVALSPDLLPAAAARRVDPDLDRLVRHELVHVAIGPHDDTAPVWLGEGLAEWVSAQALPPQQRDVPDRAVAQARRGELRTMPTDEAFNDADAPVHYALAWWVCEWLAATYGPDGPFTLLKAFELSPADADPARVVRDALGFSVDQLARRGASFLAQAYAPAPPPASPTDPTAPTAPAPGETPTTPAGRAATSG